MSTSSLDASAAPARQTRFGHVFSWAMWDWGTAAINAVATSFVFTVYLTSSAFGSTKATTEALSWTLTLGGFIVLVTAPVYGQRADAAGKRKFRLGIMTAIAVACLLLMFFVQAAPPYLWLGLALLLIATIAFELGTINYNAMLNQISTRKTVGKVSGFGWGMGYIGGIVLLVFLYYAFIHPDVGLFGITSDNGMDIRVSMLIAGIWFALSALPVLFFVPSYAPKYSDEKKVGYFESYRVIIHNIRVLWKESRHTVFFLLSSAIFRDGLNGVFTYVGVLAAGTFGLGAAEVLVFAIVANVVAGVVTIAGGFFDDLVGPKKVIVFSLSVIVIGGVVLFILHGGGAPVFWSIGLVMAMFVGPAQSASRTFLSRMIPPGREGEVFGLYSTTGRAALFIAPLFFGMFVAIGGAQFWGILGLLVVLFAGLVLLLPVKLRPHVES